MDVSEITAEVETEPKRAGSSRVGLIVPSSNTTMETEIPALIRAREPEAPDERFTFHSSRMRMRQVTPEELRSMNEQTGRAAAELADARCDVVATACLVALMAHDHLDVRRFEVVRRGQHVRDHRQPGDRVEHLRAAGSHAGALSRGEDDDGEAGVDHASIVADADAARPPQST